MSMDAWLVVRGSLPAPFEKLADLFREVSPQGGGFITYDNLEYNASWLNLLSAEELPELEDLGVELEFPADATVIGLNGRCVLFDHLPVLEVLAPSGGWFISEEGDVDEVTAAQNPQAIVRVCSAVLKNDVEAALKALRDVPEVDHSRLPYSGLEDLALTTKDVRLLSALAPLTVELFTATDEMMALLRDRLAELEPKARAPAAQAIAEREAQDQESDADEWATENEPTRETAQALVAAVLTGDKLAKARMEAWVESYPNGEPTRQTQREHLGAALAAALPNAQNEYRALLLEWVDWMDLWEEVDAIEAAVNGDARYEELVANLRELAADGRRALADNDFSRL